MTTITIDRAVLEQALEALDSCDCSEGLSGARQHFDERAVNAAFISLVKALNAPQPQPMSVDQISMIFNRVYPAQPLSQNIINLVQEVEKHHRIR